MSEKKLITLNDIEKSIIKRLVELNFEKEDIIPTMLLVKGIDEYQKKLLDYLNSVNKLVNSELMDEMEKMGFLENNSNIE